MKFFIIICESLIGLFGLYCIIFGENKHEKLHGLFVVSLAAEGLFDYFLGFGHIVSKFLLAVVGVLALFMVVFSVIEVLKKQKLKKILKEKGLESEIAIASEKAKEEFEVFNASETAYLESVVQKINDNEENAIVEEKTEK